MFDETATNSTRNFCCKCNMSQTRNCSSIYSMGCQRKTQVRHKSTRRIWANSSSSGWFDTNPSSSNSSCQMNLLLCCITLMFLLISPSGASISVFSGDGQSELEVNHMVVSNAGDVYIGAKNRIYRLSSNLSIVEQLSTGPYLDNVACMNAFYHVSVNEDECYPQHEPTAQSMVTTDNYNKLLLIDASHQKLIICSSIFQGVCDKLPLTHISERSDILINREEALPVVANTADASTVGIIANGPTGSGTNVLYTGVTFSGVEEIRSNLVAAVSSRKLDDFQFVFDNKETTGETTY